MRRGAQGGPPSQQRSDLFERQRLQKLLALPDPGVGRRPCHDLLFSFSGERVLYRALALHDVPHHGRGRPFLSAAVGSAGAPQRRAARRVLLLRQHGGRRWRRRPDHGVLPLAERLLQLQSAVGLRGGVLLFFLTLLCGGIWRFLRADAGCGSAGSGSGCGSRREAPDCGGRPAYQAYDYSGRTPPARRPGWTQRRLTPAEQKGLRPAGAESLFQIKFTHRPGCGPEAFPFPAAAERRPRRNRPASAAGRRGKSPSRSGSGRIPCPGRCRTGSCCRC